MVGMISGLLERDEFTELEKCLRVSHRAIDDLSVIFDNLNEFSVTKVVKAAQQMGDLTQTIPN